MKKILVAGAFAVLSIGSIKAQKYQFKEIKDIENTQVKSQGRTGTCWSFSTTSFLESEIIRLTGKDIDLSEMYTVRNTYSDKANNYLYRQGKAQFSEGGLGHDVINSVAKYGLVPETVFTGLEIGQDRHNHAELVAVLKAMLDAYIKNPARELSPRWRKATEGVLDVYLGENKKEFTFEGKTYTPKSFAEYVKIDPSNYVTLTSFEHAKKYDKFVLNIPDNFSNGMFYNVSLDELVKVTEDAVEKGYTIELDCDVSEKTFSSKNGVAIIPESSADAKKGLTEIVKEKKITPSLRQAEFENFNTTDDHLMHIVGLVKDQKGNKYFKVKNSWGTNQGNNGYVYMSIPYFKLKTISVLLHKDGISKDLKNKLKI
ncbi:C1 family peptidase [uncultured Tenacibaculum sp.]|uniref:aminopeptidase C n=1 Tax=uncultured Tenacibaculum sp. TaxID=174713 RepID=UPI002607B774|nr:C1 family peptidase [uncultured Tenacibaculum sp.]